LTRRPLNVVIIGVTGRMGLAVVRAAAEIPEPLAITGAVASPNSSSLGKDAGERAGLSAIDVRITDDLAAALDKADVAIDFSQPQATRANLTVCRANRKPLLIGTTGFPPDLNPQFDAAATEIPLLVAPNTSVGVTLLTELVRIAAQSLPADFDIEILETHHRMKKDSPSGTALSLGRAAAQGRGLPDDAVTKAATAAGRSGERKQGDLGFAVLRGGDVVGDHTVLFAGTGEQISLSHRATDRAVFARGALRAALWLASQPAGRYFMRDFIGVKTGA
jgi:4-hydroxy-tetrahydrodipicolinate reductase